MPPVGISCNVYSSALIPVAPCLHVSVRLCICSQGDIVEVTAPQQVSSLTDTFELQPDQRHYTLALPREPGMACTCCGCYARVMLGVQSCWHAFDHPGHSDNMHVVVTATKQLVYLQGYKANRLPELRLTPTALQ